MAYFALAAAFVCNGLANVLLKIGASKGFSFTNLIHAHWNAAVWITGVAAILFALNLVFYLIALEGIPLSIGYPIMIGMTFIITTAASIFLGEKIGLVHAIGIAMVFAGIFIIVRFAS